MSRLAMAGVAVASLAGLVAQRGAGQLSGRVVDMSGRALPLVVVVSRTNNGFLATRTDIRGRFAYPGRPHGRGHQIEAASAGFATAVYRLEGDETDITLTLRRGGLVGPGWSLGLPVEPRITVTDTAGITVSPESLFVGREYSLIVSMTPRECTRSSDALVERVGDEVVVAVATFVRSGACPDVETSVSARYRFTRSGTIRLRAVGRRRDVTMRVTVVDPE